VRQLKLSRTHRALSEMPLVCPIEGGGRWRRCSDRSWLARSTSQEARQAAPDSGWEWARAPHSCQLPCGWEQDAVWANRRGRAVAVWTGWRGAGRRASCWDTLGGELQGALVGLPTQAEAMASGGEVPWTWVVRERFTVSACQRGWTTTTPRARIHVTLHGQAPVAGD
jgi:hypothetical protein